MAEKQEWFAGRMIVEIHDDDTANIAGWRLASWKNPDVTIKGEDTRMLVQRIESMKASHIVMLDLDTEGRLIMEALARMGWKSCEEPAPNTFRALVTDRGKIMSIRIRVKRGTVTLIDFHRILPVGIKALRTVVCDGDTDWRISDSVNIAARALQLFAGKMGLRRMTLSTNAYQDYLEMIGRKQARRWFPRLTNIEYDYARSAFHGGLVYLRPECIGKDLGKGISVDYNSLYPSVSIANPLPVGRPRQFEGKPGKTAFGTLYIARALIDWTIKDDGIPVMPRRYWTDKHGESSDYPVEVTLTSIDWEVMNENYDIDVLEWRGGYSYMAFSGLFDSYVDKWGTMKKEHTGAERMIAKLMLVSLFGKMGSKTERQNTTVITNDGHVDYELGEVKRTHGIYAPTAAFINAYGRRETAHAIAANRDRVVYADTDSMHLIGYDDPKGIRLDQNEFGAWKVEKRYIRSRHVREKAYCWEDENGFDCKCSGMPGNIRAAMNWETFKAGWHNWNAEGEIIPGLERTSLVSDGEHIRRVPQKFSIVG